jgi:hypothetical protein
MKDDAVEVPNQQRHSHLASRCAAGSLEGSRESVGAVRYRAVLGGRDLICVLGGGRGDGMKDMQPRPSSALPGSDVRYSRAGYDAAVDLSSQPGSHVLTRPLARPKPRDT